MSTSAVDRRLAIGGVVLAVAGAYILVDPFGYPPGGCVGSIARLSGDFGQAVSGCVAASPQFVIGWVVGLLAIVAATWMLLPSTAASRAGGVVLAAAVLAILGGAIALATSPMGPFRTFAPTQTALPVQTSGPTTRP